jgi:hypothetical protein
MASTYDLLKYDSDEERQKNPEGPPRENFLAAATYITLLLSANNIDYTTMGGFAIICRDPMRNTSDVDIIVTTNFNRLWDFLRQQPRWVCPKKSRSNSLTNQYRVQIPNKKLLEGVIKVFVATGPGQDDSVCTADY